MNRLTKEQVLQGTQRRETVEVDLDGVGASIVVRPITEGEAAQVRACALRGLSDKAISLLPQMASGKTTIEGMSAADLEAAQRNESEGNILAAAFGMSCDGQTWTPEDVRQMPVGVPERIAAVVLRISGMSKEGVQEARRFRADGGRAGIADVVGDGVQAGA
jgi:hypothetical protein